jgi:hypothetical protein
MDVFAGLLIFHTQDFTSSVVDTYADVMMMVIIRTGEDLYDLLDV